MMCRFDGRFSAVNGPMCACKGIRRTFASYSGQSRAANLSAKKRREIARGAALKRRENDNGVFLMEGRTILHVEVDPRRPVEQSQCVGQEF
jgi:hypothetical protein